MWLMPLAQGEVKAAKEGVGLLETILEGGVPMILLVMLCVAAYVIKVLVGKIEKKDEEIKGLHKKYADKIEEYGGKMLDIQKPLQSAIEKNNSKAESIENAIKDNQELLTRYRAELAAEKRKDD